MVLPTAQKHSEPVSQSLRTETDGKSAMRSKIFSFLSICLATSGLLAQTGAAFGYSSQRQIDAEQVQHLMCLKQEQQLLCQVEKSREGKAQRNELLYRASTSNQETLKFEATQSLKSSPGNRVLQLITPTQQGIIANILLGFIYLVLPGGLCLGIFLYDKYYTYRTAMLSKQVEILEKLWKQTP